MKNLIKLESVNMWANELGVMACDDNGKPLETEIRLYQSMPDNWFQNLSIEDRKKISIIINS